MPNYSSKSDQKMQQVWIHKISEKVDLANVKPHVDKAESTPVDLNKQKNEAVKNTLQQKMKLLKILHMMTWLENLMLFKLKILVI